MLQLLFVDELNFDHAESVSGVDYPKDKQIEVVYHLGSYTDASLTKKNSCFSYTNIT